MYIYIYATTYYHTLILLSSLLLYITFTIIIDNIET